MTLTTCPRCGDRYEPREPDQRHCVPCSAEVARIIEADAKRREPRFPAKDYTYLPGLVL